MNDQELEELMFQNLSQDAKQQFIKLNDTGATLDSLGADANMKAKITDLQSQIILKDLLMKKEKIDMAIQHVSKHFKTTETKIKNAIKKNEEAETERKIALRLEREEKEKAEDAERREQLAKEQDAEIEAKEKEKTENEKLEKEESETEEK